MMKIDILTLVYKSKFVNNIKKFNSDVEEYVL